MGGCQGVLFVIGEKDMEIHFEIENKCLLQCRHCSSFATDAGKRMEYTVQDMIRFLQIFAEPKHIFLTGGEPLLHTGLDEMLLAVGQEVPDCSFGMFTTGIMEKAGAFSSVSAKRIERLAELGLKVCYFSVYAADAKEHDRMTGIAGSFALTLQSIREMVRQGGESRINLVVTRKNREEISTIIDMAVSLGCREVRLLKLVNHGRARNCWHELGLSEEEYRQTVRQQLANHRIRITASGCTDMIPCRPFEDAAGCQAGSRLAYVTYEGNVFPCASAKNNPSCKIGHLEETLVLQQYFEKQKEMHDMALCYCS